MPEITYVMPEPEVKILNGDFRFTGDFMPVNVKDGSGVLDYLRVAGAYDSKLNVWNGSVYFDNKFSVSERLEDINAVLSLIDEKALKQSLSNNGYAFLMAKGNAGKFKDYRNKGYITNLNRVIQDMISQRIPKELKLSFGVRLFKTQESVELMNSDANYRGVMNDFWQHNLEVIQKVVPQSISVYTVTDDNKLDIITKTAENLAPVKAASVRSGWLRGEARPDVAAGGPLLRVDVGVAALKKVEKS